jgi:hypothetical protein
MVPHGVVLLLNQPFPFRHQPGPVVTGRVRHAGARREADRVPGCARPPAPVGVFRQAVAKAADDVEDRPLREQVGGDRELLLFDVLLLTEREHHLEQLHGRRRVVFPRRDPDRAADEVGVLQRAHPLLKPRRLRHAIGVDERQDRAPGNGDRGVAGMRRPFPALLDEAHAGKPGHHVGDAAGGSVVGDDDLVALAREGLIFERGQARPQPDRVVVVGHDDGREEFGSAGAGRPGFLVTRRGHGRGRSAGGGAILCASRRRAMPRKLFAVSHAPAMRAACIRRKPS